MCEITTKLKKVQKSVKRVYVLKEDFQKRTLAQNINIFVLI